MTWTDLTKLTDAQLLKSARSPGADIDAIKRETLRRATVARNLGGSKRAAQRSNRPGPIAKAVPISAMTDDELSLLARGDDPDTRESALIEMGYRALNKTNDSVPLPPDQDPNLVDPRDAGTPVNAAIAKALAQVNGDRPSDLRPRVDAALRDPAARRRLKRAAANAEQPLRVAADALCKSAAADPDNGTAILAAQFIQLAHVMSKIARVL